MEVVGKEEILRHDPQTRPNRVKESPAPLVHAASKEARLEWREAFGMFLLAYREAAKLLRKGIKDVAFPEGCFPPGLPFVGDTGEREVFGQRHSYDTTRRDSLRQFVDM